MHVTEGCWVHLGEAGGGALLLGGVALLHQLRGGSPLQQHAAEEARKQPHMLHGCTVTLRSRDQTYMGTQEGIVYRAVGA